MIWYFGCLGLVFGLFIIEGYVDNMPEESKFRKFWRKHFVGEAPSDLDF